MLHVNNITRYLMIGSEYYWSILDAAVLKWWWQVLYQLQFDNFVSVMNLLQSLHWAHVLVS